MARPSVVVAVTHGCGDVVGGDGRADDAGDRSRFQNARPQCGEEAGIGDVEAEPLRLDLAGTKQYIGGAQHAAAIIDDADAGQGCAGSDEDIAAAESLQQVDAAAEEGGGARVCSRWCRRDDRDVEAETRKGETYDEASRPRADDGCVVTVVFFHGGYPSLPCIRVRCGRAARARPFSNHST